jgi:hypothetical protein
MLGLPRSSGFSGEGMVAMNLRIADIAMRPAHAVDARYQYQGAPAPGGMNKLGSGGSPGSGSFLHAYPAAEDDALRESHCAAERRALTALQSG